jgi:hypothetical protein
MSVQTKNEVKRIIEKYDPDHDLGPDCPVTWREERLARAILDLESRFEILEMRISNLMDAVPSAKREYYS